MWGWRTWSMGSAAATEQRAPNGTVSSTTSTFEWMKIFLITFAFSHCRQRYFGWMETISTFLWPWFSSTTGNFGPIFGVRKTDVAILLLPNHILVYDVDAWHLRIDIRMQWHNAEFLLFHCVKILYPYLSLHLVLGRKSFGQSSRVQCWYSAISITSKGRAPQRGYFGQRLEHFAHNLFVKNWNLNSLRGDSEQ